MYWEIWRLVFAFAVGANPFSAAPVKVVLISMFFGIHDGIWNGTVVGRGGFWSLDPSVLQEPGRGWNRIGNGGEDENFEDIAWFLRKKSRNVSFQRFE